jgi:hypothetical protein
MSRPKGSLNKRTRTAMTAAAEGKLGKGGEKTLAYLMKIANDPKRDDAVRLQAASVLLPYVKPRLASIEQHSIDDRDKLTEDEILAQAQALIAARPGLLDKLIEIRDRITSAPLEPGNLIPLQSGELH